MTENNIILLGPPASGKGTQARRLAEHLGVPCLGTGKLLRDEIDKASPVGLEAQSYIESGSYVPDEIILKMVREWLGSNPNGWLMDGFPRTLPQAQVLQESAQPQRVILLDVPREDLEFRITKRKECTTCGATVAVTSAQDLTCPECGAKTLVSRADDALDSFKLRYHNYEKLTVPLFDYYTSLGILRSVDGTQSPEKVFSEILNIVAD
jgi:adenylate kinase